MLTVMDLYQGAGLEARKAGPGELHGPCPWCGGRDRFALWPDREPERGGRFHCLGSSAGRNGCDRRGTAIDLCMGLGLASDFRSACEYLGARHLLTRDGGRPVDRWARPQQRRPARPAAPTWKPRDLSLSAEVADPARWRRAAEEFVRWAASNLEQEQSPARRYLDERWGYQGRSPPADLLRTAELGDVPATVSGVYVTKRHRWGLRPAEKQPDPDALFIPAGLLIPTRGPEGELYRLKVRALGDGGRRYGQVAGSGACPLVLTLDESADRWAVVEGELDAWILWHLAGDLVSVVGLGSTSVGPDPATWERLRSARKVLLMLDRDRGGRKLAARGVWTKQLPTACPAILRAYKDPGEAHSAGVDLRDLVLTALRRCAEAAESNLKAESPAEGYQPAPETNAQSEPLGGPLDGFLVPGLGVYRVTLPDPLPEPTEEQTAALVEALEVEAAGEGAAARAAAPLLHLLRGGLVSAAEVAQAWLTQVVPRVPELMEALQGVVHQQEDEAEAADPAEVAA